MTRLDLTVNGTARSADVEPRTHLADFLRETLLLTGTHLGCEHGVCGACTVLLNGEPVRSCITYAAMCQGAAVHSIEGLEDDPVMTALRAAFTAAHALQCGYCTPGMLVTARDIVRRLPEADDDRIRLELSGNLCRCTGYNGIVTAIRRVLDAQIETVAPPPKPVPLALPIAAAQAAPMPKGTPLTQSLRIGLSPDIVWAAIQNPEFVAACVPGAGITTIAGNRITGEMQAGLGPIQARFTGTATLDFDQSARSGRLAGTGQDSASNTRLSAEVVFTILPDGADATQIRLDIAYALRGGLAQFSRGPIVSVFAAEIAATVARNLEARLRGTALPAAPRLGAATLLRIVWGAFRRWLGRHG